MNAMISATVPTVETLPLGNLYLSGLNPRQDHDAESIALLADSIVEVGLMQNLGGLRDAEGRVAIVFGGRRLAALQLAVERRPELALVPVAIAPDEETARLWGQSENFAREALDPADAIRAFGWMRDAGSSVTQIARIFAVMESQVYRFLALANLPVEVIDALKAGDISFGMAKAFTVSQDRDLLLTVLAEVKGRDVSEQRIRTRLQPAAVSKSDRRAVFVGIDAYEAAGGIVTRDLFSDSVSLTDPDLLHRLFTEKLNAFAPDMTEGWHWCDIKDEAYVSYTETDKLCRLQRVGGEFTEEETARYDELSELAEEAELDADDQAEFDALQAIISGDFTDAQRAVAGFFVYVDNSGALTRSGPYVRTENMEAAVAAGVVKAAEGAYGQQEAAPKSPYSGALIEDMKAIRLAAVQKALLDKPELVLSLFAFGLSAASGVTTNVFDMTPGTPNNCPKESDGLTTSDRLAHLPRGYEAWTKPELRCDNLSEAFRAFTAQGKKARNEVITEVIARTLPYGAGDNEFFRLIEADAGSSMRQNWTPTAASFFGRVSGGYLDDLFTTLLDIEPGDTRLRAFTSQKKKAKAEAMERLFSDAEYQAALAVTPDQKARIAAWLPDCF